MGAAASIAGSALLAAGLASGEYCCEYNEYRAIKQKPCRDNDGISRHDRPPVHMGMVLANGAYAIPCGDCDGLTGDEKVWNAQKRTYTNWVEPPFKNKKATQWAPVNENEPKGECKKKGSAEEKKEENSELASKEAQAAFLRKLAAKFPNDFMTTALLERLAEKIKNGELVIENRRLQATFEAKHEEALRQLEATLEAKLEEEQAGRRQLEAKLENEQAGRRAAATTLEAEAEDADLDDDHYTVKAGTGEEEDN